MKKREKIPAVLVAVMLILFCLPSVMASAQTVTPKPAIDTPVLVGATRVSGTSVPSASISLIVDNGTYTATAGTNGNWTVSVLIEELYAEDTVYVTARAPGDAVSKAATVTVMIQTTTPTINAPVLATATRVNGTSMPGASIWLTVNGGTAHTTTASVSGNWTVSSLTLAAGEIISVTAKAPPLDYVVSKAATATVQVQTPKPAIDTPVLVGATRVSGMSVPSASISLIVDNRTYTATAGTNGNWTVSVLIEELYAEDTVYVTARAPGDAVSKAATVTVMIQTTTPTINAPVLATATRVNGTSMPGASIWLTVNGGTAHTTTASVSGNWTVSSLTLTAGEIISVTAKAPPLDYVVSKAATATVQVQTSEPLY